jgi:hypothetical protein
MGSLTRFFVRVCAINLCARLCYAASVGGAAQTASNADPEICQLGDRQFTRATLARVDRVNCQITSFLALVGRTLYLHLSRHSLDLIRLGFVPHFTWAFAPLHGLYAPPFPSASSITGQGTDTGS